MDTGHPLFQRDALLRIEVAVECIDMAVADIVAHDIVLADFEGFLHHESRLLGLLQPVAYATLEDTIVGQHDDKQYQQAHKQER